MPLPTKAPPAPGAVAAPGKPTSWRQYLGQIYAYGKSNLAVNANAQAFNTPTGELGQVTAKDPDGPGYAAFNSTERQVQRKAEVPDSEISRVERFIRRAVPEGHRKFFHERSVLYIALKSPGTDKVVSGLLAGPIGFAHLPDDQTVSLDMTSAGLYGCNAESISPGALIGILGLEHETRRRNRVNGRVASNVEGTVTILVDQSFGNCPKYIQKRSVGYDANRKGHMEGGISVETSLRGSMRAVIEKADTFFIASSSATGALGEPSTLGVDMSHRGGPMGFCKVSDDGRSLRWADYKGNNFFMTLGNIAAAGLVSLLFLDFESSSIVCVEGQARIEWDAVDLPGAERTVAVDITTCTQWAQGTVPIVGGPVLDWSPHNPETPS